MVVSLQRRPPIANLSLAALSLVLMLRCNVYDDSLLGNDQSVVGGSASVTHSGTSGTTAAGSAGRAGIAGELETDGGANDAGSGGLLEAAGAVETGGSETSGGTAGSANVGGTANGGTGGAIAGSAGAGSTIAGSTGSGGATGGTGGANQTASGCAKLSVPLDDAGDKAHFVITLASTADLSGATISMRYYVPKPQGGSIFNYVQDSGTYHFLGVPTANRQLLSATGWSTVSWNVGAEPDAASTGIVKTSIKSIGIELNAQPSATWTNPTVVYVDSLTVQSPALSFTFDANSSVSTSNTTGALWLNSNSLDTTATGSTVTWLTSCP